MPTSEDPIVAGIIFGVNIISQIQMDEERRDSVCVCMCVNVRLYLCHLSGNVFPALLPML